MDKTIFCIDDTPQVLLLYKQILEEQGYTVVLASSGFAGLELLLRYPVDCFILDYRMPQMDGADVIRHLACRDAAPPVILVSGSDPPEELQRQVEAFIHKPMGFDQLLECIEGVIGSTDENKDFN